MAPPRTGRVIGCPITLSVSPRLGIPEAVISSPAPEQGGDLRVCVVDMSMTQMKAVSSVGVGRADAPRGCAVRRARPMGLLVRTS